MRRLSRSVGLAILVATACCPDSKPCLAWAASEQSFELEIVEPTPPGAQGRGLVSCGELLTHHAGDHLQLTVLGRHPDWVGGEGCDCYTAAASFILPDVQELGPYEGPGDPAGVTYRANVKLVGGCRGALELSVTGNYKLRTPDASTPVANHGLLRRFRAELETREECLAAGLSEFGSCQDIWFARVLDSDGKEVLPDESL